MMPAKDASPLPAGRQRPIQNATPIPLRAAKSPLTSSRHHEIDKAIKLFTEMPQEKRIEHNTTLIFEHYARIKSNVNLRLNRPQMFSDIEHQGDLMNMQGWTLFNTEILGKSIYLTKQKIVEILKKSASNGQVLSKDDFRKALVKVAFYQNTQLVNVLLKEKRDLVQEIESHGQQVLDTEQSAEEINASATARNKNNQLEPIAEDDLENEGLHTQKRRDEREELENLMNEQKQITEVVNLVSGKYEDSVYHQSQIKRKSDLSEKIAAIKKKNQDEG